MTCRRTALLLNFALSALALTGCASAPAADVHVLDSVGSGGINRPEHRGKPHVVLVSLDGFKPAYLTRFTLPNIQRVVERGAVAQAMIPVFPSLTFPNHVSLVTGLRPDRHGIVSNTFYDPARKQRYSLSDVQAVTDGSWYRGEPIWVTAERQGMVAACYFWPGSEAAIAGVRPTFYQKYDTDVPNDRRVNTVLEWLALPDDRRPHLLTLYFSELDSASHDGPLDAPGIRMAAESLDRSIGALLDGIERLPARAQVYVLLTSDHGMVEAGASRIVELDSIIDMTDVEVAFGGPVASLHVRGGAARARVVRDMLNAGLTKGRAYLRADVPARHHYSRDPRVGDVVVIMDESWMLVSRAELARRTPRERFGMHGWDPDLPSMDALFAITGPRIRRGLVIPQVRNVDVYPLMAELLGLRPAAGIDGASGRLRRQILE